MANRTLCDHFDHRIISAQVQVGLQRGVRSKRTGFDFSTECAFEAAHEFHFEAFGVLDHLCIDCRVRWLADMIL